jgi:tRNA-dihydrouridine synthase
MNCYPVHYRFIAQAVAALPCPVLANGNVDSAQSAAQTLRSTGARGLMIGRGAIRNPWLFRQIRQAQLGETVVLPVGHEVLAYVKALYESECDRAMSGGARVQRMKKFMNYLGAGVEPTGQFLNQIRRAAAPDEFFGICERFLAHGETMRLEPFPPPEKAGATFGGEVGVAAGGR